MATGQLTHVLAHLRTAALHGDVERLTDGQLLRCFIAQRDESAFAALVRRHGGMVRRVCQRVAGHHEDAQDAFQATFLVLARKASSVAPPEMVGNWLYGVAYRTALEARVKSARRRSRERQVLDMPHPTIEADAGDRDLLRLLDAELHRLPDKYRTAIVLCELEGRSRADAAIHLQVPEGTLSSRLATGRKMLAERLTRRGFTMSIAGLTTLLAGQSADAAVSSALANATAQAALAYAAGNAALVSAKVAILTEGVLKAMLLTKLKTLASWSAALLVLAGTMAVIWNYVEAPAVRAAQAPPAHLAVLADENPPTPVQAKDQPEKKPDAKPDADQAFTNIHLKMGKAVIRQTGKNAAEVKGDPLFAKMAKTSIADGTLTLRGTHPDVEFAVEVKDLAKLKIEGISTVDIKDIKAKRLEIALDGVARVTLAGSADELILVAKGPANFHGESCKTANADVTIQGPGIAIVNVADKLKVKIPTIGRVEYVGAPKVIDKDLGIAATLRQRDADTQRPLGKLPAKKVPAKEPINDEPAKPGSVKITAKVDGHTQGTEFNNKKYPFKYTGSARLDKEQLDSLAKPGDIDAATAKALAAAVLWPGMNDKVEKVKLKSDGKQLTGDAEVSHKYGKQGTHTLKFKLEGTIDAGKLTLRAVDPVVTGAWDWGGGSIKLTGKVVIVFEVGP